MRKKPEQILNRLISLINGLSVFFSVSNFFQLPQRLVSSSFVKEMKKLDTEKVVGRL